MNLIYAVRRLVFERLPREYGAFFEHLYTERTIKSPVHKTTMSCGNLTDKFLGLGLWAFYGAKKTLQIDTKSNPERNQTTGL
jgi:hypothetical protein